MLKELISWLKNEHPSEYANLFDITWRIANQLETEILYEGNFDGISDLPDSILSRYVLTDYIIDDDDDVYVLILYDAC